MAGFHLDDTIAAVSTAMAPAGIGIVRISGNDAFEVADRVFRAKKEGKKLSAVKSHTIHYGWITEGEEVIDEVLVMVMKGPKTYTGENTVEIDCHGGVLAVKKVLEAVLNAGARAADPGEFTKRAFLNGRMDLTQAEAVMDVISAKSAYALKSSESQLRDSHSVLRVAVNGNAPTAQIGAEGISGNPVDLHAPSAHARADKALPHAAADAADRPCGPNRFIQGLMIQPFCFNVHVIAPSRRIYKI